MVTNINFQCHESKSHDITVISKDAQRSRDKYIIKHKGKYVSKSNPI